MTDPDWPPEPHDRRVRRYSQLAIKSRAAALSRKQSPNSRAATEEWLTSLNLPLCDVWFYVKDRWFDERHVDDDSTLRETIGMTMQRTGARYAMRHYRGRWELITTSSKVLKKSRFFDTREAAEMVAIHGA